jgi:hypothetical protein
MIHVVEEIKILLFLVNHMVMTSRLAKVGQTYPRKHIRGNVRYLVTWNTKQFTVGYFPRLDKLTTYRTRVTVMKQSPNSEYKDSM